MDQGQLIVSAEDPSGPWSEPVFVAGALGVDPDLAWDEQGVCHLTWSTFGDASIILQAEIDSWTGVLLSEPQRLWSGTGLAAPEAPHVYLRDGWWYLLIAEGGTARGHAVSVARSRSITGPYEGNPANPIFTHRSTAEPVQSTGHADLVELPSGRWAAVYLGVRPRGFTPQFHVNGRETFLAAVRWEDKWPVFHEGHYQVPQADTTFIDEFDGGTLGRNGSPARAIHSGSPPSAPKVSPCAAPTKSTASTSSWPSRARRAVGCRGGHLVGVREADPLARHLALGSRRRLSGRGPGGGRARRDPPDAHARFPSKRAAASRWQSARRVPRRRSTASPAPRSPGVRTYGGRRVPVTRRARWSLLLNRSRRRLYRTGDRHRRRSGRRDDRTIRIRAPPPQQAAIGPGDRIRLLVRQSPVAGRRFRQELLHHTWETRMTEPEPVTELSAFSSDGAIPTEWGRGRGSCGRPKCTGCPRCVRTAVRMSRRCWESGLSGALYFCTGPTSRKPRTSRATRVAS